MENKLRRGLALLMTLIMLISCAPMDALAAIVPVSGGTQISSGVSLEVYLLQQRIDTALGSLPIYADGTNGWVKRDLFTLILTVLLAVAPGPLGPQ